MPTGNQPADHRDDLIDVRGCTRLLIGRKHPEAGLVLVHGLDHATGQIGIDLAVLVSAAQNLVVDIGDIAHVVHIVTALPQIAGDHIKGHQHPGMAQVTVVIHRHAAHVHAHFARLDGFELFLLLAESVVDSDHAALVCLWVN